jgi:hypothetical protein
MAKHVMMKYFNYCDKHNNKIFYCNTNSILIRETDIGLITQNISDHYRDLKVEGKYNNGAIISQGKYSLFVSENRTRPHEFNEKI